MNRSNRRRRCAFSLLELVAATAIMGTLMAASFSVVRTAHNAWRVHKDGAQQREAAVGALQHVARKVRQATNVISITAATDGNGALTLLMPDNSLAVWGRDSGTNEMRYGTATATDLLAPGITDARFTGYKADGVTATTSVELIHCVKCALQYSVTRPSGSATETVSCVAFLRAW